jgi:dUTP pyrophosphatase
VAIVNDQVTTPQLDVEVVRLDLGLPLPAYAHELDAGVDLRARHDVVVPAGGGRAKVATGVAIALPQGYAGFVLPRSGNAWKWGLTVVNAPGLIDAGYRDELHVLLLNTDPHADVHLGRGDRIAQLVVQRVEQVRWHEVSSFDDVGSVADRGGGFGHSGSR